MRHHRDIDVFERALFQHDDLAAAAFLGWRAQDHDAAGQLRADCGEAGEGRERGGANEVVAAGVAVGQRVVLREDCDGRARSIGLAGLGAKGRFQ
jgi:hypothetical protein